MESDIVSATLDQAADWYLKHRSEALSAGERQAFAEWLRASPLHVREYLAIAALSKDLPGATNATPVELQALIAQGRVRKDRIVRLKDDESTRRNAGNHGRFGIRQRALAVAVIALAAAGVTWYAVSGRFVQTAHGEQRLMRLSDGSLVHLNSETRARVRYSDQERAIEVQDGQAMFEVERDALRPFKVRAGSAEITAIGTKFDVYKKASGTTVTVLEGKVQVRSLELLAAAPLELAAGEQTRIAKRQVPSRVLPVDTQAETAWLQGNIKFFRKPLGEVAEEFNRYSETPVEVQDKALRDLKVSGIFNAYDTESFLEFLRSTEGVAVRSDRERIVIGKSPP